MTRVLVFAEHTPDGAHLAEAVPHAVTAAAQLGEVSVLVAGADVSAIADQAAAIAGVSKVLVADAEHLAHPLAEALAPLLANVMADFDVLLAAATTTAKNVLPRAAALLDVQQISDVAAIEGPDTFLRPFYAGNAIQRVRSTQAKTVLTVRAPSFAAAELSGTAAIEAITDIPADLGLSRFVGEALTQSARPELTAAKVVVAGGRGLGSADNFKLIEDLADKLGAAVGASRAAVDAGFAPNDAQVGQTGKVVAPDLYIAIGISGAIQHLAGMKDSRIIVAINSDEEAPIFAIADYGLVGDLNEVVPKLLQMLDE